MLKFHSEAMHFIIKLKITEFKLNSIHHRRNSTQLQVLGFGALHFIMQPKTWSRIEKVSAMEHHLSISGSQNKVLNVLKLIKQVRHPTDLTQNEKLQRHQK